MILDRGLEYKDPDIGTCQVYSRNREKVSVAGEGWVRGRMTEKKSEK